MPKGFSKLWLLLDLLHVAECSYKLKYYLTAPSTMSITDSYKLIGNWNNKYQQTKLIISHEFKRPSTKHRNIMFFKGFFLYNFKHREINIEPTSFVLASGLSFKNKGLSLISHIWGHRNHSISIKIMLYIKKASAVNQYEVHGKLKQKILTKLYYLF